MALVLNEWLFQVTKPSFLTRLSLLQKLAVGIHVSLILSLLTLLGFGICWTVARLINRNLSSTILLAGIPAGIISISLLLMVDNFTGTLFGFSMGTFTDVRRFAYAGLLLALFAEAFRRIIPFVCKSWQSGVKRAFYGMAGVSVFLGIASVSGLPPVSGELGYLPDSDMMATRPNVIILSTDGLNASSVSAYGYPRATTPFLESLASETLRFEDHFTNASHTTGSIVALLTGRYPTHTKVVYRPDILAGKDAFRHLPGLLRQHGYNNLDLSLKYYADPFDLNLRHAFQQANGRLEKWVQFGRSLPLFMQIRYDDDLYFLEHLICRIVERLGHAMGLYDLGNPYFLVTHTGTVNRLDEDTVAEAVEFLRPASQPFFLHLHLLGTHGPKFGPAKKVFSVGQDQRQEWMTDFYDDAVLAFDRQVKNIFDILRQRKLIENTIVVITSDHGQKFSSYQPVPLIMRFPGGVKAGVISGPTQQIDIAPTLLDYLKLPVPSWMDGQSLLSDHYRKGPIFSVYPTALGAPQSGWREAEGYFAPYYSLGGVSVRTGGTWCGLSLRDNNLACRPSKSALIYPSQQKVLSEKTARKAIIEHLRRSGYDVTTYNH